MKLFKSGKNMIILIVDMGKVELHGIIIITTHKNTFRRFDEAILPGALKEKTKVEKTERRNKVFAAAWGNTIIIKSHRVNRLNN